MDVNSVKVDFSNPFKTPYGARAPLIAVQVPRLRAFDIIDGDKVLPPIRPNAGVSAAYRRKLEILIGAMHRSVMRWVIAAYRANEPEVSELAKDARRAIRKKLSFDALPANELAKVIKELKKRWTDKFDEGAGKLADYFVGDVAERTDAQMRKILKDAGWTVKFELSKAQRDIAKAAVHESVSLIKSIPEQYFKSIEGAVMRSVATGRDLGALAENLEKSYGVERRRAAFISRDQNNKTTAVLKRAQQLDLGIEEEIWQHSSGGKQPRKTHVAASLRKQKYKVSEGWLDPAIGVRIWPGTEPNCKCIGRSIIKGFV